MSQQKEQSFGIVPLEEMHNQWRVFLIQHKQGEHWGFPKGHRNASESGKEAAIRELLEETAMDVSQVLSEEPFEEYYQCTKHGQRIDKTVFYYPAIVQGTAILQHEEIAKGEWFFLEEAKKQITFQESRNVLEKVIQLLEGKGHL